MTTARTEFLAGIRAELPILLGVVPFGMIYGALAVAAGLPTPAAQAMSSIVFAGSAQFILTQLIPAGAPPIVLLLTVFVVNLRHILYSASVAPYLHGLKTRWKWLLAYLLTDEAYAVTITHYRQIDGAVKSLRHTPPEFVEGGIGVLRQAQVPVKDSAQGFDASPQPADHRHWFFLGAGLALWSCWQVSTAIGIFLGTQVPPSWSLDFTLPLTFIALMIPALVDRPAVAAAVSAGAVAVIGAGWPYKMGLVAAAIIGITVGTVLEGRRRTAAGDAATGSIASSPEAERESRQQAARRGGPAAADSVEALPSPASEEA